MIETTERKDAPIARRLAQEDRLIQSRSDVLCRIDRGQKVTGGEMEAELQRLEDLLRQEKKGKLKLTHAEHTLLFNDHRRLKGVNEIRCVMKQHEREANLDQDFREVLKIGLTDVEDPALLLHCIHYCLRWKVRESFLQNDREFRAIFKSTEWCLKKLAEKQKDG